MQQFRFSEGTAFTCFRCGDPKKAKLITIYGGNWARRLCNGCYGRLLSLYDIKAGTAPDDEKAEALASALFSIVAVDDRRKAEQLFRASDKRASLLSPETLRFVATAEHVAQTAAISAPISLNCPVRYLPRPPVPMMPVRMRSLAPKTRL
jgi:hypothetical protein